MVSSSFGLSNFKLRGVFCRRFGLVRCAPGTKIKYPDSSQTSKKKKKVAHRKGGGRSPRATPGQGESCASPRGLLRHSPRPSSWVQRGQAGRAVRPRPDAPSSAEVNRCYTTSPGCGAATHVLFGVLEIGGKGEGLGKGAAR